MTVGRIGLVLAAAALVHVDAAAKDILFEDFNGYYVGGIEVSWDRAFPNGTFWEETAVVTSPPRAQKFAIYVGEAALPGDSGIWWGGGWSALDLLWYATDMDPTRPWSLTCNVYGHNDGGNPDEPPGCWWCEFQVLSLSGTGYKKYGRVFFDSSNNDTWQQITFQTDGSESGDHVITLILAIHWGNEAEPVGDESYVIFDDIMLTYTPATGDGTPPGPVEGLEARRWDGALELSWTAPPDADFAGTLLRYRTDHYPVSATDGQLAADVPGEPGAEQSFMHEGLTNGEDYFYAAFAYDAAGNRSEAVYLSASPHPGLYSPAGLLPDGWAMVGSPRQTPVPWADCSLTDGAQTKKIPEAIASGWMDAFCYYYDDGYKILSPSPGYDDEYLRPWYGYWILLNQPGLQLVVPAE